MAEEKKFEFKGKYTEKGIEKKFTKFVSAENEKRALELLYTLMGSKHRLKRRNILIEECKQAKESEK